MHKFANRQFDLHNSKLDKKIWPEAQRTRHVSGFYFKRLTQSRTKCIPARE